MTAALRRKIHVACLELGLDQDTRHDLQLVVTGKSSMKDMDEGEMKALLKALEERGFRPSSKGASKRQYKPAPRADLRFVHVLWKLLGEAGQLREPGRAGLNAFIRRRFGDHWQAVPRDVDDLREWAQIDDVIQALLSWCDRTGVKVDREAHR